MSVWADDCQRKFSLLFPSKAWPSLGCSLFSEKPKRGSVASLCRRKSPARELVYKHMAPATAAATASFHCARKVPLAPFHGVCGLWSGRGGRCVPQAPAEITKAWSLRCFLSHAHQPRARLEAAHSAASTNHLSSLPSAARPISSFRGVPPPALGAEVLPLRLQSWLREADTLKKGFTFSASA